MMKYFNYKCHKISRLCKLQPKNYIFGTGGIVVLKKAILLDYHY